MHTNLLGAKAQGHAEKLCEVDDLHIRFATKLLLCSDLVHFQPAMTSGAFGGDHLRPGAFGCLKDVGDQKRRCVGI